MRIVAYYIVTARPELLTAWPFDPDLAQRLQGPLLYKHNEADRSAFFREDHIALVKLLILALLKAEYTPELDDLPVTIRQFDIWWTIERLAGLDGDLDEECKAVPPTAFTGFEPTGRPVVDAFVQSLLQAGKREV